MPNPVSRRSFLACLASSGLAYASGKSTQLQIAEGDSLRVHAASQHLLYGSAVNVDALRHDEAYARLLREQCSILVAENCMKWNAIEPIRNQWQFDAADYLVAFAEKQRIKMRGHTLIWHKHVPEWITSSNVHSQMRDHIMRLATRYAGRMHSWDVVNEAVDPKDGRADGLRNSAWLQMAGEGYIEEAFRTARLADPSALLTYNDYGIEGETKEAEQRRIAILLLLRRLRARNVPIDAVGIQSHLTADSKYGPGIRRFIASVRDLDLQVFVTELDVDGSKLTPDLRQRDIAVANTCSTYLKAVLPDPAVRAVITWGITQKYSWLPQKGQDNTSCGLPFDTGFHPTPLYQAIRSGLDERRSETGRTFGNPAGSI